MKPIYLAALLSFLVGFCGYTIIRYWLIPILRYRKIKRGIWRLIAQTGKPSVEQASEFQRLGAQLSECAGRDLPRWYHIHLRAKGMDPLAAVPHLTALARIKDSRHRDQRILQLQALLGKGTPQS